MTDVYICNDLEELGDHPFKSCDLLTDVTFEDGGNYTCDESIIYGLANGAKNSLLEVLETRGDTTVNPNSSPKIAASE